MRFVALFAAVLALSACNTFRGIGQDLEAGGEAISNAANNTQDEIRRDRAPQPVYRPAPQPQVQPRPVYPAPQAQPGANPTYVY